MPFLHGFGGANKILSSIESGKCNGSCKQVWMRNIQYALKTKTNPLKLTTQERKTLKNKIKNIKINKNIHKKTSKKYKERKSPPYSANENCGKIMMGNDKKKYKSVPNINNICSWKKIK